MQNGPTDFSGDSDEGNNQQSADVDFSDDSGTDDALLEFDKMVLNPGTAHITHNAANTLEEVMPTYKMRTHQLGAVCDLCREQKHRPRSRLASVTVLGRQCGKTSKAFLAKSGDTDLQLHPSQSPKL